MSQAVLSSPSFLQRRPYTQALLLLATAAGVGFSPVASSQDYPSRPIRLYVGPGPDILARIVGEKLASSLGQPVVIEQRPAAGGIVAGDTVAKAAPDGYSMLLTTGSYTINSVLQPKMPYSLKQDLKPVSLLATLPFVLVVNPSLPIQNLKELLAQARSNPGKINYASSGSGTPAHLAGEMLKQMAKVEMVHIPYKSAGAGLTDLMGGQVQMMFAPAPSALPLIRSGKLRAISVSSPKRYSSLPDVPTVAEEGYPDFLIVGWNGLHVPVKTPLVIIDKLNAEVVRIMRIPDVQERAIKAGFEPIGTSIKEFEAFQNQDIARMETVIKAGNIQPE